MKGEKKPTIAIIVRRNREVERVLSLLEANGIPASAERGADIFSHPIGVLFFSILEYLADPSKTESLAKTLTGGLWGLDFAKSAILIKKIRSEGSAGISLREIPVLGKLKKEITTSGAIAFLILAGELSGLAKMAARNPLSAEVWRSIIALARDIASRGTTIENPVQLIEELLSYRASAETKSIKISTGAGDSQIRVMTAHSSKGLEYDYVFLPYATEESWMTKSRGSSFILPSEKDDGDEIRDTRRLFYVALTRARNHAVISYGLEEGLARSLTPLRFIDELDAKHATQKNIPAVNEIPQGRSLEALESDRKNELIEYAKNVLLEKGLSVTALNHFCKCPSEFFYKSILKLPEPPSASSEKGNAMHEALSQAWRLENKSVDSVAATIEGAVKVYFDHSLLPLHEKEVILEELLKAAPKVAATLFSHLTQLGDISTETWMDTSFEGKFGDQSVSLKLHGKLDAVVDTADRVFVFDYKTREAMSENAIKGFTKDSDGAYFRQLTYYKILCEGNSKLKNKLIEPALVFVKPDDKGRCPIISLPVTSADMEKVKAEVQSLIESVWSGKLFSDTCAEKDCEWCKMKRETL